mmetsp:Transcript_99590/g.280996  ORF Transcript_99590/g.280996 Transcript_99590/m.280996 type:complete len:256 (+) Transcript_99590:153-920(+)
MADAPWPQQGDGTDQEVHRHFVVSLVACSFGARGKHSMKLPMHQVFCNRPCVALHDLHATCAGWHTFCEQLEAPARALHRIGVELYCDNGLGLRLVGDLQCLGAAASEQHADPLATSDLAADPLSLPGHAGVEEDGLQVYIIAHAELGVRRDEGPAVWSGDHLHGARPSVFCGQGATTHCHNTDLAIFTEHRSANCRLGPVRRRDQRRKHCHVADDIEMSRASGCISLAVVQIKVALRGSLVFEPGGNAARSGLA